MQVSTIACMGWRIEIWERPSGAGPSQDAQLVMPDPARGRLRVAVLDGVTPTERCRTVVGVDGAMYAAAMTRLALQHSGRSLERCILAANEHLHDARLARSRDQRQACVSAADIGQDGSIELVRAGDCEAWGRTGRGWVSLGSGSALTAEAAVAWDAWERGNAGAGRSRRHHAEERELGRPEAWTSTALGRFARPVLRRFSSRGVSELVLASDGARLSADVLDDLPDWLAALRGWERRRAELGAAAGKVHDDVTVLRLRRVSARIQPVQAVAAAGQSRRAA